MTASDYSVDERLAFARAKQEAGERTPPHHHYLGGQSSLPHLTPFGPGTGRACVSTGAQCWMAFEAGTVSACQACIDGCDGCGALLYVDWHKDGCPRWPATVTDAALNAAIIAFIAFRLGVIGVSKDVSDEAAAKAVVRAYLDALDPTEVWERTVLAPGSTVTEDIIKAVRP